MAGIDISVWDEENEALASVDFFNALCFDPYLVCNGEMIKRKNQKVVSRIASRQVKSVFSSYLLSISILWLTFG